MAKIYKDILWALPACWPARRCSARVLTAAASPSALTASLLWKWELEVCAQNKTDIRPGSYPVDLQYFFFFSGIYHCGKADLNLPLGVHQRSHKLAHLER